MRYVGLFGKSIVVVVIKAGAAVISFFLVTTITKSLGARDSGLYFTAFSMITILALAARTGLDQAALKLMPRSKCNPGLLWKQKNYFTVKTLIISVGLVVIVVLLIRTMPFNILALVGLEGQSALFYSILPSVIFLSVAMVSANIMKAISKAYIGSFVESFFIPALTILMIPPLTLDYGVVGAGLSYTAATFITFLIAVAALSRNIPRAISTTELNSKEIIASSSPLFAVTLLQLLIKEGPVLLAAIKLNPIDVSMLAVASRLSLLLTILLIATTTVLAPIISRMYSENKHIDIYKILTKTTGALVAIGLVIMLIAWVFGELLLAEAFGEDFRGAFLPMILLMAGQLVNISTGPVQTLLIMSSNEKFVKNSTIAFAVVTLILATGASFYGVIYISAAVCVTTAVYNMWLMRAAYTKCGMCPFVISRKFYEKTL